MAIFNTIYGTTSSGGGGSLNNLLDGSGSSAVHQIKSTANGSYSFAEGFETKANGQCSHAEGMQTSSTGTASHTEGYKTTASNNNSHAEGYQTYSASTASHTEGYQTTAQGIASHAGGIGTWTNPASTAQTAIGRYNTLPIRDHAFIIGNGTSATASNAFTVSWDGDVTAAGAVYLGSTATGNAAVNYNQMTDYVGYKRTIDGFITVMPPNWMPGSGAPVVNENNLTTPASSDYLIPFLVSNYAAAPVFTMQDWNCSHGYYLITGNINVENSNKLFESTSMGTGAVVVEHFLTLNNTILGPSPSDYEILNNNPAKYERKKMFNSLWPNVSNDFNFIIDTNSLNLAATDKIYLFGYVTPSYPVRINTGSDLSSSKVTTTVTVVKIG